MLGFATPTLVELHLPDVEPYSAPARFIDTVEAIGALAHDPRFVGGTKQAAIRRRLVSFRASGSRVPANRRAHEESLLSE